MEGGRNTKQKFIVEALKLFSEKGYEAVSVAEIAKAVGCSAPALYKHYESKQDLLDAIIKASEMGFSASMLENRFGYETDEKLKEAVINLTEQEEIDRVKNMVKYAIHNEFSQAFRKLCVVEQYHMKNLAEVYDYRYITYITAQYEKIFKIWIEAGRMKGGNPQAMATLYTAYPIMAIGICDRNPAREDECMEKIEEHLREFNKQFRIAK